MKEYNTNGPIKRYIIDQTAGNPKKFGMPAFLLYGGETCIIFC